jgi:hypothetical protein
MSPRRPHRLQVRACQSKTPPQPAPHRRDENVPRIRWTDRVALQAQVGSAEETLVVLLDALRNNLSADVGVPGDDRAKDEGLDALYTFANLDVWSLRSKFFGRERACDLGQFERFKKIMVSVPYAILLCVTSDWAILSTWKVEPKKGGLGEETPARCFFRVRCSAPHYDTHVFDIAMSRGRPAAGSGRASSSWMVDSLVYDPAPLDRTDPSPPRPDLPPPLDVL